MYCIVMVLKGLRDEQAQLDYKIVWNERITFFLIHPVFKTWKKQYEMLGCWLMLCMLDDILERKKFASQ